VIVPVNIKQDGSGIQVSTETAQSAVARKIM